MRVTVTEALARMTSGHSGELPRSPDYGTSQILAA